MTLGIACSTPAPLGCATAKRPRRSGRLLDRGPAQRLLDLVDGINHDQVGEVVMDVDLERLGCIGELGPQCPGKRLRRASETAASSPNSSNCETKPSMSAALSGPAPVTAPANSAAGTPDDKASKACCPNPRSRNICRSRQIKDDSFAVEDSKTISLLAIA